MINHKNIQQEMEKLDNIRYPALQNQTESIHSLFDSFRPKFADEKRMEDITHIMNNTDQSYQRRLEKMKERTSGYEMNEYERKFAKKLVQRTYEFHLSSPKSANSLKERIAAVYSDYSNDMSQEHRDLMKEIAGIAGNRGYSHEKRLEKINSLLIDPLRHYNPLNDAERDFIRNIYDLEFNHIKDGIKRKKKVKDSVKVGKSIMQARRDFENFPGYLSYLEKQSQKNDVPPRPEGHGLKTGTRFLDAHEWLDHSRHQNDRNDLKQDNRDSYRENKNSTSQSEEPYAKREREKMPPYANQRRESIFPPEPFFCIGNNSRPTIKLEDINNLARNCPEDEKHSLESLLRSEGDKKGGINQEDAKQSSNIYEFPSMRWVKYWKVAAAAAVIMLVL